MLAMTRARFIQLCLPALLCAACQTEKPASQRRDLGTTVTVNGKTLPSNERPPGIDAAVKSDPCAARLHAISGTMLMYYALHNRLPPKLDDLRALQEADQPLNFACPASGQRYVYVPTGLVSQDDNRQIILHDPTPEPTGVRWTILMQKPQGRQPAAEQRQGAA